MTVRPATPADAVRVAEILTLAPVPREVNKDELSLAFSANLRNDGTGEWVVEEEEGEGVRVYSVRETQ